MENKNIKMFSFADSEVNMPMQSSIEVSQDEVLQDEVYHSSDEHDSNKYLIDTEMIWSNGISVSNSHNYLKLENYDK